LEAPTNNSDLFNSDLWQQALERYASAVQLTIKLFDTDERPVFGPINPTPLFQLIEGFPRDEPALLGDCVHKCLAQKDQYPAVVSEFCGLTVIGAALVLDGVIVGVAVGAYALTDFCQFSEIQRLARYLGIGFDRLWQVAREQTQLRGSGW
jgi:ligand-binding sensor protein